jgi:hypothetical protein
MATLDLSKFVGTWMMEGRTFASPFTKDGEVHGRETFESLGDRFLVHKLEGTLGDSPMACVDVTDRAGAMHAYYNDGSARDFVVTTDDVGITYHNTIHLDAATYQNRCIVRFLEDGTREATWQCSLDGNDWVTYWKAISKRVTS